MKIPRHSVSLVPITETSGISSPTPIVSQPVPQSFHGTPVPTEPSALPRTTLRGPRVDRLLLVHCRDGFVSVSPLTQLVPRASLYRHVAKLIGAGCLTQRGRTYQTTVEGLRRLAEAESAIDWTMLEQHYPPLRDVPSAQHRAVIELILAAIAARRAGLRDDHHPGFVLFGRTLAWKSSTARFVCMMLGLSPATHLIDLATESGQSLWLRRDSRGEVTFQREILTAPFLAFDEYLEADPKVRNVIQHFLCGRTNVPFENVVLTIDPVCLVTMNARPKASLQERTTFGAPQLRRLLLCDVDRIPLPDLALMGEQPLQAAAQHEPLAVPSPRIDCQSYRPQIVRLVREVITLEAQPLVDVEMVMLLCAGMSGFLEEDERAIQQTFYDLALVLQTLGWVQQDWLAAVSGFSLYKSSTAALPTPADVVHSTPAHSDIIILRRDIMEDRESLVPKFCISEEQKAKLIWMSEHEGVPVDHALDVLLSYYKQLGENRDLHDLNSVMRLSKELKLRELSAWDVHRFMQMMRALAESKQTLDHLQAALDILPALEHTGLTPGSAPEAETIHLAARLTARGVTVTEVEHWLTRRQSRRRPGAPLASEAASHE